MEIKVLKVYDTTEATTLRFTNAMRIGAVLSEFQARPNDIMKIPRPGKYYV